MQNSKLVEAEVTSLPASLIVVSGLCKDFLHLPRRGHVTIVSELDKNLTFRSAPLDKRQYFTLQVGHVFDSVLVWSICITLLHLLQDTNLQNFTSLFHGW